MIKEKTYKKWIDKYGEVARIILDVIEEAGTFPKELGRIFLNGILKHINNKEYIIIDKRNWIFFHYIKREKKMRLSLIMSKDKKGKFLLNKLEKICKDKKIPIIRLTCVSETNAKQWYLKNGFIKIRERKSKIGTKLTDFEKRITVYKNILEY